MPISYAGIGLTPTTEANNAAGRYWHEHRIEEWEFQGFLVQGIQHLPTPYLPMREPPRVGVFSWPNGADRFAECHLCVPLAELTALRTALGTTPGPNDLVFDDGAGGVVTAPMYLIAIRPISDRGDGHEYGLLTFVDERWFWWQSGSGTTSPVASTWAGLFTNLFGELGLTITQDSIPAAYLTPNPDRWDLGVQPIPPIISAAAKTVGMQVVRSTAGAVSVQSYATAAAADTTRWTAISAQTLAGGRVTGPDIARGFPSSADTCFFDGTYTNTTLASLSLTLAAGVAGVTAGTARITADPATPTSGQKSTYAAQAALDYYQWGFALTDATLRGFVSTDGPCGLDDLVEWVHTPDTMVTRVLRSVWSDRNVYGDANAGTPTPGVSSPYKEPVRVATVVAGTLASSFAAGQVVDNVTLVLNDRILIKDQSSATENGIYVVQASGAPIRSLDADTGALLLGAQVTACEGDANADTGWLCSTDAPITIGASAINWEPYAPTGFPAELTGVYNGSTGYPWTRLTITGASTGSASPTVTGTGAVTPDNNTALVSGQRGWLVYDPRSTTKGRVFIPTPPKSPLTTKGDIYVYSTQDTRLPVGSNGYVLSSDSTQTTGLKWTAGYSLTVAEVDGIPTVSPVDTILFDQADGFVVTNPGGGGTARVDIDRAVSSTVTIDRVQTVGTSVTVTSPTTIGLTVDGVKRKEYFGQTAAGFVVSVTEDPSTTDSTSTVNFEDTGTISWALGSGDGLIAAHVNTGCGLTTDGAGALIVDLVQIAGERDESGLIRVTHIDDCDTLAVDLVTDSTVSEFLVKTSVINTTDGTDPSISLDQETGRYDNEFNVASAIINRAAGATSDTSTSIQFLGDTDWIEVSGNAPDGEVTFSHIGPGDTTQTLTYPSEINYDDKGHIVDGVSLTLDELGSALTSPQPFTPTIYTGTGPATFTPTISRIHIIECWGPGGHGSGTGAGAGSGGGGGEYRRSEIILTSGTPYPLVAPPAGSTGINTTFNTTGVVAVCGGDASGTTGGTGGTGGTGDVGFDGGSGKNGGSLGTDGGGGGGSGGTDGAGATPTGRIGGAAGTDGGNGGDGGTVGNPGTAGVTPGGGGGGSGGGVFLAAGGAGRVIITPSPKQAAIFNIGGNAETATKLGTARNISISGDLTWTVSFDGSANVTAAGTIGSHVVTYAKMQQVGTHTLLGNPTGSTADVSEITLGAGLSFSGTTLVSTGSGGTVTSVIVTTANGMQVSGGTTQTITGSGTFALTLPFTLSGSGSLANSGTSALTAFTGSGTSSGTNSGDQTTSGTANQVAVATGSSSPVISLIGPHGFTTQTAHGVLLGQGTSAITATAVMTDGQLLVGQSAADPLPKTINGSGATITVSAAGVVTISAIANASLTNSSVTISGHALALGGTLNLVAGDVGLGSVTNDAQTKAAIVPNTTPTAGQVLVGNAGGTAYAPVTMSGDATLASTGALTVGNSKITLAKIANASASSVLLGSGASGSGAAYVEIALGTNLSMSGTTLNATGGGGSGTVTSIVAGTGLTGGTITTTGTIAVATDIPQAQTFTLTDAGTAATPEILGIRHNTSGTPTINYGGQFNIYLQDSTTTNQLACTLQAAWSTATHASRQAKCNLRASDNAGSRQCISWGADGTNALVGFFGATAVAQQTGDVGTAAVTFGLMTGTPTFDAANVTNGYKLSRAPDVIIYDQKTAGTEGGSSSAGVQTRTLQTIARDPNSYVSSLSSNQFTLVAGNYYMEASAPALYSGRHLIFLYNATDAADVVIGDSQYNETASTTSFINKNFTIAASKALEIRHEIQFAHATNGLGAYGSSTRVAIYTVVKVWRLP